MFVSNFHVALMRTMFCVIFNIALSIHFLYFQVNKTFSPLVDAVDLCNQWLDHWSLQVSEALTNSSEHLEVIDVFISLLSCHIQCNCCY